MLSDSIVASQVVNRTINNDWLREEEDLEALKHH